jgi:subtilisin family serine protease
MYTSHLAQIADAFMITDSIIGTQYPDKKITVAELVNLRIDPEDERAENAVQIASAQSLMVGSDALWETAFTDNISKFEIAVTRVASLDDPSTDPRLKIGDDLSDFGTFYYGNNHIYLKDSGQGTVHAGIIAAKGNNDLGFKGMYSGAEIMVVRAYPEGEEYDKDIAASIHYAVNNGAKIINIGFCKTISPYAGGVAKAIEYAAQNDVLVVRAAGDMGIDMDESDTFPSIYDVKGKRFSNMIVVGASDLEGNIASFSNYGAKSVDLFAPGSDIVSIFPDDEYARFEGTSLSAAIVSGIAAILRSHFPNLSAKEIRDILIESACKLDGRMTTIPKRPGTEVDFSTISLSGGIVDADSAVDLIMKR